ncbi:MAG: CBS domain-containing protein [Gemmatimonadota bacterium]|nr:MAG: CBS domain-containing protein [Gemmatimonadota bacterium]
MAREEVDRFQVPPFGDFTKALLNDLRALERMVHDGLFETGVRRVGAEQELFLVDRGWRPAAIATDVLQGLTGSEFTTELARFNAEINLPPLAMDPGCFSALQRDLERLVDMVRREARKHKADVVLMGILPTLEKSDLGLENLTPHPRYYALNEAITQQSGGSYRLHIQGTDELYIEHDSILLEGCNTSYQVHLQVDPAEFARLYNAALVMAGPVLAACVNSPLLFSRRLWSETRIALFQQALDTRRTIPHMREFTQRVRFGESWVRKSVLEIFQEDVARVPALLGSDIEADPFDSLRRGHIPDLQALQLYNGTVYRWIRPCYGVTDGKPHLRIECRFLPSGPSILDQVANTALWIGLILGANERYEDVTKYLDFDSARANFLAAARRGLNAGFTWFESASVSAPQLLLEQLLPLAQQGLEAASIDPTDASRLLQIIERRVSSGFTGAHWLSHSLTLLGEHGTRAERMAALTAAAAQRQQQGIPVHEWRPAEIGEGGGWRYHYRRVEQYMTTDLFTVKEDEIIDLAALLMDWKRIRQVLVEDDDRRLSGWVTYGSLLRLYTSGQATRSPAAVCVRDIMEPVPVCVAPGTQTLEAIALMRQHKVRSLPVIQGGRLVGIVSVEDFIPIAERLLEEKLEDE